MAGLATEQKKLAMDKKYENYMDMASDDLLFLLDLSDDELQEITEKREQKKKPSTNKKDTKSTKKPNKESNKKTDKKSDKKPDKRARDRKISKKITPDTNVTTKPNKKRNSNKTNSDSLRAKKKRNSTKINDKRSSDTLHNRKKRDSTKIIDKRAKNAPNGRKKRNSTNIIDKKPVNNNNKKRNSKSGINAPNAKKKRNSTKINPKRTSNSLNGQKKKRNSTKIDADNCNQNKQRNSKKVRIKKTSDSIIVHKKDKEKSPKNPLKLGRSKSGKIASIKEAKPTKPSLKSRRSKSKMIGEKTSKENINKNTAEKASKTKEKRESKTSKHKTAQSKDNMNHIKEHRASRPEKRVTMSHIPFKDKTITKASEATVRAGSTRMTRRATKKLMVDGDGDDTPQEEEEQEYRPREYEESKDDDGDDSFEDEESEDEASGSGTVSSPNIVPSLAANASKPSKKDEDIALFKEYDEMKRAQWDMGSQVKVYSCSEKTWLKGKVIKVSRNRFYYEDGEWLKLLYHDPKGNELTKSLPRKDRYLKHSMRLKDFKKDKYRSRAVKYIADLKNKDKTLEDADDKAKDVFGGFHIGQKCEYRDRESKTHRWRWCRVFEVSREEKGMYVRIEIYGDKGYKQSTLHGFKLLRATIPLRIKSVMINKWKYLAYRIKEVPELMEARHVHLNSMADFYQNYEIADSASIPNAVAMLIRSQNVKLFPILIFDVENTLVPTRFIDFVNREYDSTEQSKLFRNLDELSKTNNKKYRYKDMRYAQVLGAKMFNIAMRIDFVFKHFCGKMAVISDGAFDEALQDLICELPDSAGGYIWREMFKRYISGNNQNDEFGLYSAESVFQYECVLEENIMDLRLDTARELAMVRYLRAKLMGMEYDRLKDDSYYIPVIFAVSEESKFHSAVCNAAQQVFQSFYRVVNYEIDTERVRDDDWEKAENTFLKLMLNNRYIEKIFIKCMKHPYIEPFLKDDVDEKEFEQQTWHKVFSDDQQLHFTEVIKI